MEYNVQHWADTRFIERISCFDNKTARNLKHTSQILMHGNVSLLMLSLSARGWQCADFTPLGLSLIFQFDSGRCWGVAGFSHMVYISTVLCL